MAAGSCARRVLVPSVFCTTSCDGSSNNTAVRVTRLLQNQLRNKRTANTESGRHNTQCSTLTPANLSSTTHVRVHEAQARVATSAHAPNITAAHLPAQLEHLRPQLVVNLLNILQPLHQTRHSSTTTATQRCCASSRIRTPRSSCCSAAAAACTRCCCRGGTERAESNRHAGTSL